MIIIALRLSVIIIGIGLFILLLTKLLREETIKRIYQIDKWLIENVYLYFVDILIFLRPLKKRREAVGLALWLFFVLVLGRYMIVEQPLTMEIKPAYLPFIGYIYFLSVLYLVKIIFEFSRKDIQFH